MWLMDRPYPFTHSYMASSVNRRTLICGRFFSSFSLFQSEAVDLRFGLRRWFLMTVAPSWLHHTAIVGLNRWSPRPFGIGGCMALWPCAQETHTFPVSALQMNGIAFQGTVPVSFSSTRGQPRGKVSPLPMLLNPAPKPRRGLFNSAEVTEPRKGT
jgi:hypothetical protein